MSELRFHYWCDYLTEVIPGQWRPVDYDVRAVVRGLKQEAFNGYLEVKFSNGRRRFDQTNIEALIKILMPVIGRQLSKDFVGPVSIVPIPNSGMALGAKGSFRCVELATMVAEGFGAGATVCQAIRWKKQRDKAHKGNEFRSPDVYEPLMQMVERPPQQVVLFDDVLTSGSQMTAAARVLSKQGVPLALGLVVAKATKDQHPTPFMTKREDVLDLDPYTFDFLDLG